MSNETLELARRYEDLNRGDIEAVTAALAPEVEWYYGHPRLPEPSVRSILDVTYHKLRRLPAGEPA